MRRTEGSREVPWPSGHRVATAAFLLAAALGITNCGAVDPLGSNWTGIAGNYRATSFSMTVNNRTVDLLAAGGRLDLVLVESPRRVTGLLFIPATPVSRALMEDMAGSWSYVSVVKFTQTADTFVGSREFRRSGRTGNIMSAEGVFGDTTVSVTLTRPE